MRPKIGQEHEDLITYLYKQVKQMIWENTLKPGEKIRQEHLAQMLGVSRTPVIKALQRLCSERLVEYIPRHGFSVKKLTVEEMMEIFAIREVVEGVAARAVTEKASDHELVVLQEFFAPFGDDWDERKVDEYRLADQRFHAQMIEIAGNSLLIEINEMFNIYRFSYQRGLMRHPRETLPEHLEIIKAIKRREPYDAQRLAMNHMAKSRENITRAFAEKENNG